MKSSIIPKMYHSEEFESVHGIHITVSSFFKFKEHRHNFYEFEYVLEGEGVCRINGQEFPIKKGDVVFVTPTDVHDYKSIDKIKILTVHFEFMHLCRELSGLIEQEACIIECTDEMKNAFEILRKERDEKEFRYFALKNLLERIVLLFLRKSNFNKTLDMPKVMADAVAYINLNYSKNISLKNVAEIACYSPEYFCRQFRKITGKSFVEYVTDIRALHAKNLLSNTDMTVTEVCYESGFGSIRSLDRAFWKKYGCTPKEYKKQNLS